ncbi:MAG: flagellar hook-basal body complex protein FliE [Phycisphaerales bacterium]|nr:flagellar hook-basal body complex protein FliE [Phycisphaerales bacterium]
MTDPIGLIGASNMMPPVGGASAAQGAGGDGAFKDMLLQNLAKVNELQQDATKATEDLMAGRRNDIESVLMATQKADTAFRMLLQVRNKVLDVYQELKQLRV